MIKFLDLKAQYQLMSDEINEAIQAVISESAFIGGKFVAQFEKEFAQALRAEHCVGVGNGTDALEIAIEALNLPSGSEIIVPANTFIATSEAVTRTGHKVVFCDVDERNLTVSINDLKNKISDRTSAIIAVHLYGHPCDMDELLKVARENRLSIIEDCAQAHFAEFRGRKVGTIGDIGAYSFYPGKNLGAYGDAGAIVSNNEELAYRSRMIANHGRSTKKYEHQFEGRNSRLDGIQAAILSVKLKYLDKWTNDRIQIADFYNRHISSIPDLQIPFCEEWAKHVYHLYVIRTKRRDELQDFLTNEGIQTGIHYPIALPKLDAYSYLEMNYKDMYACKIDKDILSLPIGDQMSPADAEKVSAAISAFFMH